jgi:hypothetical protein
MVLSKLLPELFLKLMSRVPRLVLALKEAQRHRHMLFSYSTVGAVAKATVEEVQEYCQVLLCHVASVVLAVEKAQGHRQSCCRRSLGELLQCAVKRPQRHRYHQCSQCQRKQQC